MLANVLLRAFRTLTRGRANPSSAAHSREGEARQLSELLDRAHLAYKAGVFVEAQRAYEAALDLIPDSIPERRAAALVNIGVVWREMVCIQKAIACLREALVLQPRSAVAHYNLGLILYEIGETDAAEASLDTALEIQPDFQAAHSTRLCLYGFARNHDPLRVLAEHRRWAREFADPLTALSPPHTNKLSIERPITVGYVSADFKEHSIARFISPILANHDHERFRVICYDNWPRGDATTERLRRHADVWRKIDVLNDQQVAELVRADGVDILIDLSGHTTGNRLLMFARKPAPVQASWLGYMSTTGMAAMDWHITDANLDPPGTSERWYTERLMRIHSAATFEPHPDSPPVNEVPALKNGFIRFGSFNNYTKIGGEVIRLWSRLLVALPQARLMLVTLGGDDPQIKAAIATRFEMLAPLPGVSGRVEVIGRRSLKDFLHLFHQVDIALDSFPHCGGTTSLHTLWMGVAIVCIEGNTELSRSTSGMLKACGLDDLVAHTEEEYLKICLALASDPGRLAAIRSGLRRRLSETWLGNGPLVTRNIEDAYRAMWAEYASRANNAIKP